MAKRFDMQSQLAVGAMGVQIIKTILRGKYSEVVDYQDDREMQKRGIDLWVKGLGFIEVKTDSHKPVNFFLELDVSGKPGAVDRSCSDYFCVLFYKHQVVYLIPRAELQQWLRENMTWIEDEHPAWIKTIGSQSGKSRWSARGVTVPRKILSADIDISVIAWTDEDEVSMKADWGKGD